MAKTVIYTAIFGGYDLLKEPLVRPENIDFVCFSDQKIASKNWEVRVVTPTEQDATRNNRKYKILPHRYLGGYALSVYVDGNMRIRGSMQEFTDRYGSNHSMAMYDCAYARHRDRGETPDNKDMYQEAERLIAMHQKGRSKEAPERILKQIDRYREEGYPEHRVYGATTVLLRHHNRSDVARAMEAWWKEYKNESKRDQLSFNYITWKTGFQPHYIPENVRNNEYFLMMSHG